MGAYNSGDSVIYATVGAGNTIYIKRGTTVSDWAGINVNTAVNIDDYGTAERCATWSRTGGTTAIQLSSNGSIVRDICVTGDGSSNLVNITATGVTLSGVEVHNNAGAGAGISFTATSVGGTLTDVTVHDIADDGVNIAAAASGTFAITNLDCYMIDTANSLGDCIQANTGSVSNVVVSGGRFVKETNTKSAIIYDGSGTLTIKDRPEIYLEANSAQGIAMWGSGSLVLTSTYIDGENRTGAGCVFVTNTGTATISGLITLGCDYGAYVSHASGTAFIRNSTLKDAALSAVYHTTGGTLTLNNNYMDAPINIDDASAGATTVADVNRYGLRLGGFRLDGASHATLAAWQAASSQDANSTTGVDPEFVGGATPTTRDGFRLKSTSPLRRVGKDLNIGTYQDALGRGYLHPPSIGGLEATSGDARINKTAR
ncbi:MAG: right-handed parallel beta-helix repeat-containing protein [Devosia sp.]